MLAVWQYVAQYPFLRGDLYGKYTTHGVESVYKANLSVRLAAIGGAFLGAVNLDNSRRVQACRAQSTRGDGGVLVVPRVKQRLETVQAKASSGRVPVTLP